MNLFRLLASPPEPRNSPQRLQRDTANLMRGYTAIATVFWFNQGMVLVGVFMAYQKNLLLGLGMWGSFYATYVVQHVYFARRFRRQKAHQISKRLTFWQNLFALDSCIRALAVGSYALVFLPDLPLMEACVVSFAVIAVALTTSHVDSIWSYTLGINGLRFFLALMLIPATVGWMMNPLAGHFLLVIVLLFIFWVCELLGKANIASVQGQEATARRLSETALQLEAANAAKTRLLVEASHDLRQPVHALEMMVSLLRSETQATPYEGRVRNIQNSVNTLSDMLTDLLDMSRLDDGKYIARLAPTHLFQLMQDLQTSYAGLAQRKGLGLYIQPSSAWITTDSIMLQRILNNILVNAIKYTSKGHISVSCVQLDQLLWIEIRDTGMGIEQDKIRQIFADYARLDEARSEHGYGIGLSVVKRMAELLGCSVRVTSEYGKGSVFSIGCPYLEQQFVDTRPDSTQISSVLSIAGVALCLIENDPLIRSSTAEILRSMGVIVVAAANANEAYSTASKDAIVPNLILTDMHLDGATDGLQVIAQLRAAFGIADLPAILITGDLDKSLQERAAKMLVEVTYKPVRSLRLRDLIARHVAW